jgi:hypothetical protein
MVFQPRAFRLHVNRLILRAGGKNVWTVHVSGQCLPCSHVQLMAPCETVYKPKGQQPRATVRGTGIVMRRGSRCMIVGPGVLAQWLQRAVWRGWRPI